MFRERSPQASLLETNNLVPPAKAKRLRAGWAETFRRYALPLIDEGAFASLYCAGHGRPNRSVQTVLGVLLLKEMHGLTDAAALEHLEFDLQWHHALELTPEEAHLPQKTLHNFRARLMEHDRGRQAFAEITDRIRQALGSQVSRQRLDSTHVMSNIAVLTRLGLFCETIRHFLKQLASKHPRLSAQVPERLRRRYLKEDGRATAYQDAPSGTGPRRLPVCARDVYRLHQQFAGTSAEGLEAYALLQRLLAEQCDVTPQPERPSTEDDDAGEGGAPVAPKAPEQVGSDTLQSPHDADATYGRKGKGYEVQIAETCVEAPAEARPPRGCLSAIRLIHSDTQLGRNPRSRKPGFIRGSQAWERPMARIERRFTCDGSRRALLRWILIWICLTSVSHASPPPADSAHFCLHLHFNYEQWRRDHPLPAGKRAAVNAGEPRTVRMIYFLPKDRPYQGEVVQKIKNEIRNLQTFYAEQMEAHGYERKTFRFETDASGEPLVHRVDGQHPDDHYHAATIENVSAEIHRIFDMHKNNYFVVIDNGQDYVSAGGKAGAGIAASFGKIGGWLLVPEEFSFQTAAHELGHTFGLTHDFRDGWVNDYEVIYVMGYGPPPNDRSPHRLSECAAGFLAVHPYFNPAVPTSTESSPTVELLSATEYPAGSESVSVRLKLSDAQGLHQVILFTEGRLVWGCRDLTEKDEEVEFDFTPHNQRLSQASQYRLRARVVNTRGDVADMDFLLGQEVSSSLTAVWEAHGEGSLQVQFSPDGKTLGTASASVHGGSGEVFLWDVQTRDRIAVLSHERDVHSQPAFSPDGRTLATGISDGTIVLWDVTTRTKIATLRGHTDWVGTLSFSPDGKTLASGGATSADPTARLWDVASRTEIGTLEGHERFITSLAFSPDGEILASGGGDNAIKLWDVQTRELSATLALASGDRSAKVAFSPDGATLVSGSNFGVLQLWDVATRTEIATLAEDLRRLHSIYALAISPDGTVLAFGLGSAVWLWNLATRTEIANLAHPSDLRSLAFSPDGATLVSGVWNGSIHLWNLVELTRPRPFALEIISGDGQQGSSGSPLTEPFVVSVVDQNGSPYAGVTVTFVVPPGGGSVSGITVTTDANGLATTTLTLGPQPGTNTVEVTVAGLDPVTFTATGLAIPTTLAGISGDEQEAAAGTTLPEPFVVEVRDQNNSPLEGAEVAFVVTAGDGTLSAAAITTDPTGRAATTLTLGPQPGTNTVEATVAGLDPVTFTATGLAIPTTLAGISGDEQEAAAGTTLPEPFVVEVRDQNNSPLEGAEVAFVVTAGDGTLSAAAITTDPTGRAATTLTLGPQPGTNTVEATVAGFDPVTFTATAQATPDFDGDGVTYFSDFFLLAEAFGGTDPRFDLDGNGTVDFDDFFLFAESFGQPARAKLAAMARELIGLPDGPQLEQNAPNPFNSETVISWFQLQPGPARLEVFALTGQRVAVLREGPNKAGFHRLRWDARDDRGRPLASGVYVCRLVTAEAIHTRKLTLLR